MTTENKPEWMIDKKIPLVLIIGMVLQTMGFGWWAGTMTQRVTDLEKRVEVAAPQIDLRAERLVRVETKMDGLLDSFKELRAAVQRMPPPT